MSEEKEQQILDDLELIQRLSNRISDLEIKIAELGASQKENFNLIKQAVENTKKIVDAFLPNG